MKTILKISIPIIFLIVGFFIGQDLSNLPKILNVKEPEVSVEKVEVGLMLDYGDGKVVTYNDIVLDQQITVFDLLLQVASDNDLEFSYNDQWQDLGVFIESINNVKNDTTSDMWWHYWVNNKYAPMAADKYMLKDGDITEWKFIRSQFEMEEN